MTTADALPSSVLRRRAVVYVRQSSQSQVQTNLESKRRQYDLVEVARQHGFHDVEVIDDDLGRSASGTIARPGAKLTLSESDHFMSTGRASSSDPKGAAKPQRLMLCVGVTLSGRQNYTDRLSAEKGIDAIPDRLGALANQRPPVCS